MRKKTKTKALHLLGLTLGMWGCGTAAFAQTGASREALNHHLSQLYEIYNSTSVSADFRPILLQMIDLAERMNGLETTPSSLSPSSVLLPPTYMRLAQTQGGLVQRPDQVAVAVPPAALTQDVEISIAYPDAQPARATVAAEKKLVPVSLPVAFGPEGTTFAAAVTITLPYDPALVQAQGLREADLKVHYWNEVLQAWEALPSRMDATEHLVSADVRHFSVYQVLGAGGGRLGVASGGIGVAAADAAFGFKAAYAFPNPARGQNTVTIRVQPGLADSVEVRVYDLSGRKVHASSNFNNLGAFDDGNGLGPQFTYDHVWGVSGVGSGVYTYAVTARKSGQPDIVKTGKLGIVK